MSYDPVSKQAVLGFRSVFADADAILSTGHETSSGPVENVADWLTYDFWASDGVATNRVVVELPEARPVDYLAIAAHNLGTIGATDVVFAWSDDGVAWTNVLSAGPIDDDAPKLWTFPQISHAFYRASFLGSTGLRMGVICAGEALTIDEGIYVGHAPANLNKTTKILNNDADGGQLLGRSIIRQGAAAKVSLDKLSPEFVRGEWSEFVEHSTTLPFFFAWRTDEYPGDVIYGWTDDDPTASQQARRFMNASFTMKGIV